jgi:hypothetical protein
MKKIFILLAIMGIAGTFSFSSSVIAQYEWETTIADGPEFHTPPPPPPPPYVPNYEYLYYGTALDELGYAHGKTEERRGAALANRRGLLESWVSEIKKPPILINTGIDALTDLSSGFAQGIGEGIVPLIGTITGLLPEAEE